MLFFLWMSLVQVEPIRLILHSGTVLICSRVERIDETWSVITLADGFEAPDPYQGVRKFKIRNALIAQQEMGSAQPRLEPIEESKSIQIDQSRLDQYTKDHPPEHSGDVDLPGEEARSSHRREPDEPTHRSPLVYEPNRIYERPQDLAGQEALNRMFQDAFDAQIRTMQRAEANLKASFERYSASTYNVIRGYVSAYSPEYYWSLVVADRADYEAEYEKADRIMEDARRSGAKLNRPAPELNQRLLREIDRNK